MADKKAASEIIISGIIEIPQQEAILLLEAGHLLVQMKKAREAHDIFAGVASMIPHSDVPLVALGNLYFAQGKLDLALKEHENAIKRQPNSAMAYAHIGEIKFFQRKFDEGKTALQKAIDIDPKGLPAEFAQALLDAYVQKAFE